VPATNAGEHLWTRNFLHEAGFDLLVSPLSLVQPQLLNLLGRDLAEAHHHGMGKMYSLARVQAQGFGFKIREGQFVLLARSIPHLNRCPPAANRPVLTGPS
jgi:hypothetical protein